MRHTAVQLKLYWFGDFLVIVTMTISISLKEQHGELKSKQANWRTRKSWLKKLDMLPPKLYWINWNAFVYVGGRDVNCIGAQKSNGHTKFLNVSCNLKGPTFAMGCEYVEKVTLKYSNSTLHNLLIVYYKFFFFYKIKLKSHQGSDRYISFEKTKIMIKDP